MVITASPLVLFESGAGADGFLSSNLNLPRSFSSIFLSSFEISLSSIFFSNFLSIFSDIWASSFSSILYSIASNVSKDLFELLVIKDTLTGLLIFLISLSYIFERSSFEFNFSSPNKCWVILSSIDFSSFCSSVCEILDSTWLSIDYGWIFENGFIKSLASWFAS